MEHGVGLTHFVGESIPSKLLADVSSSSHTEESLPKSTEGLKNGLF